LPMAPEAQSADGVLQRRGSRLVPRQDGQVSVTVTAGRTAE
jgi:hypothetical protein